MAIRTVYRIVYGCQVYMLSGVIKFLKCIMFKSYFLKWFSVRITSNESLIAGFNIIQFILVVSGDVLIYKGKEMKKMLKTH